MKGSFYTRQKCGICGGKLFHNERLGGFFCDKHKQVQATGGFIISYGRSIRREFSNYEKAWRFITGLRWEEDRGVLDPRDHQADNPLAFDKLAREYIAEKEADDDLSPNYKRKVRYHMTQAIEHWGDRNVKHVGRREIKHFIQGLPCNSKKTKANYQGTLHNFFQFIVQEEYIERHQIPEFPKINYTLGWRPVTDLETQNAILDELRDQSWDENPKVWIGVDLLRTYTNLRPGDLLRLDEKDVDVKSGVLTLWHPTKKKNNRKTVLLLDEHRELLKEMKTRFPALPNVKFFRHHTRINNNIEPGQPFSNKYIYRWFKRACSALGVEQLDLYGSTRHTTVTELAKMVGRDGAKEASGHETNKAFDRYCQMQTEGAHAMAKIVRQAQKSGKLIDMRKAHNG